MTHTQDSLRKLAITEWDFRELKTRIVEQPEIEATIQLVRATPRFHGRFIGPVNKETLATTVRTMDRQRLDLDSNYVPHILYEAEDGVMLYIREDVNLFGLDRPFGMWAFNPHNNREKLMEAYATDLA